MTWPGALYGIGLALSTVLMATVVVVGSRLDLHPIGLIVFGAIALMFAFAAIAGAGGKGTG